MTIINLPITSNLFNAAPAPAPAPADNHGEDPVIRQLVNGVTVCSNNINIINNWTKGGAVVISSILQQIFDNIKKTGASQDTDYEDLLQLAYLDMMERNTLPSTISPYILEATGTGNHTSASYLTSANILDMYNAAANEPATSLAYSVYKYIKDTTANNKAFDIYVRDFQSNYWTSKNGFMDGSVGDPSNRHLAPEVSASQGAYCPWLRLLILSTYINKNPNASQDNYITIINGDSNTIKGLLNIKGNDSLCDWLIKNQSPNLPNGMHTYNENDFSKKELSGVVINQGFLDIKGTGVELGFIRSLLKDFPARQLTHDEIADINRNADYSKILYECIKNRIHSTTEDKQAIARNIG